MTMKLRMTIIIGLLMTALSLSAQSASLKINQVFDGLVIPIERMVLTRVKGKALSKYRLTYYRSAQFICSTSEAAEVTNFVLADKATSDWAGLSQRQTWRSSKEQLVFALPSQRGHNRFISLVKEKQKHGKTLVTLIYMEGSVGDVHELNKLIKQ